MGEETQVPQVDGKKLRKVVRAYSRATKGMSRADRVRLRAQFNWDMDSEEAMDTVIVTPERMVAITEAVQWYENRPRRERRARR